MVHALASLFFAAVAASAMLSVVATLRRERDAITAALQMVPLPVRRPLPSVMRVRFAAGLRQAPALAATLRAAA